MKIVKLLLLLSAIFAISCNRQKCKNSNVIFDQHEAISDAYKKELIAEIERVGESKVKYWIEGIEEKENANYLVLYVQGDELCAIGYFKLNDPSKLEDVIRTSVMGYRGARIKGFAFDVVEGDNIELVYKNLKNIVD